MPRAYENDLRRKFLDAYVGGKGTLAELAQLFGVSVGWAEKVSGQYRRSGQAERAEQRHGPPSRVDEAAKRCLLQALEARPDLTLAELQKVLAERRGIQLCVAQVWNVLKRMGVRLKKSRSTPRSATASRIASAEKRSLPRSAPRQQRT
jgi:transposase